MHAPSHLNDMRLGIAVAQDIALPPEPPAAIERDIIHRALRRDNKIPRRDLQRIFIELELFVECEVIIRRDPPRDPSLVLIKRVLAERDVI